MMLIGLFGRRGGLSSIGGMMQDLKSLLNEIGEGQVPKERFAEVVDLLKVSWDSIYKPQAALYRDKLDRVEQLEWKPPLLRFRIERHGGTVLGSTRAELQVWSVDLDVGEASYDEQGHRQIGKRARPWFADEPAREVAQLILNGASDPRLRWLSDEKVQILTREIVPDGRRQTVEGRRRRFYQAFDEAIKGQGWVRNRSYCIKSEDS